MEECIQRVICCAPHASASRPTIGKVKDAWADVYTELVLAATGAAVASESAAPRGWLFFALVC